MSEDAIVQQIAEKERLLAYFSFLECNVCKTLLPKVKDMIAGYAGVDFLYIDINRNPLLRGQYLVFSVPTLVLFEQGRETKRFSRYFSLEELKTEVERINRH
jgi:thioredoxin 1